jgi:hypothetical protein
MRERQPPEKTPVDANVVLAPITLDRQSSWRVDVLDELAHDGERGVAEGHDYVGPRRRELVAQTLPVLRQRFANDLAFTRMRRDECGLCSD